MNTIPSDIGFITSFREFSRNTEIRKKAIAEEKPILIEDKRAKEFFFLVPQKMYKKLLEKYTEWCDAEEINKIMNESDKNDFSDWKTCKKELFS